MQRLRVQGVAGEPGMAIVAKPQLLAFAFTIAQITLGVKPSPEILPALLIGPRQWTRIYTGSKTPTVDRLLHPCRNGNGPYMAAFSSQVGDHPTAFSKLEILEP